MYQKNRLLYGFGLLTFVVSLLCFFFVFTNSQKASKSEHLFDMSIEELMKIEVTIDAHDDESQMSIHEKTNSINYL